MTGATDGLHPAFIGRLETFEAALGLPIHVTSGLRDLETQRFFHWCAQRRGACPAECRARTNCAPANPPGRSRHNPQSDGYAYAADIAVAGRNPTAAEQAAGRTYGLVFPIRGEPWHAEPPEKVLPEPGRASIPFRREGDSDMDVERFIDPQGFIDTEIAIGDFAIEGTKQRRAHRAWVKLSSAPGTRARVRFVVNKGADGAEFVGDAKVPAFELIADARKATGRVTVGRSLWEILGSGTKGNFDGSLIGEVLEAPGGHRIQIERTADTLS